MGKTKTDLEKNTFLKPITKPKRKISYLIEVQFPERTINLKISTKNDLADLADFALKQAAKRAKINPYSTSYKLTVYQAGRS